MEVEKLLTDYFLDCSYLMSMPMVIDGRVLGQEEQLAWVKGYLYGKYFPQMKTI